MIAVHRDMQTNVCKKLQVFDVHTCFDWSLLGGSAFEGAGDAASSLAPDSFIALCDYSFNCCRYLHDHLPELV